MWEGLGRGDLRLNVVARGMQPRRTHQLARPETKKKDLLVSVKSGLTGIGCSTFSTVILWRDLWQRAFDLSTKIVIEIERRYTSASISGVRLLN